MGYKTIESAPVQGQDGAMVLSKNENSKVSFPQLAIKKMKAFASLFMPNQYNGKFKKDVKDIVNYRQRMVDQVIINSFDPYRSFGNCQSLKILCNLIK